MNKQNSFSNKTIEALKMAIEAMERAEEVDWELNSLHVLNILQAIKACKKALAEAEKQEPVACSNKYGCKCDKHYTHPAIWQSLSDDNILKLFKPKFECEIEDFELVDFARAIEQALKEKNHG